MNQIQHKQTADDTTAPTAPTADVVNNGTQVTGTAEPGSTVTVKDQGGNVLGTAVTDENGNYTVDLTTPLTNGEVVDVTAKDVAGNESEPTQATADDTTAPTAPTADVVNNGTQVTGTAEPGSTVTVKDQGGNVLGTAVTDENGNYTVDLTTPLTNGEVVDVTAKDVAGNESEPTQATADDTTAPDAPTAEFNHDGSDLSGTAEPGSTVTVKDQGGNVLGTTVTDENGNYTVVFTDSLNDGEVVDVTAKDVAGNESTPTEVTAPNIPVDAVDNLVEAGVDFEYPVTETTLDNAISYNWLIGFLGIVIGTTSGSTQFSVQENQIADVTLEIKSGSWASFFDSVAVKVSKFENGSWVEIGNSSSGGIFDFIGVFGQVAKLELPGLASGQYKIDMSSFNAITLPGFIETDIIIKSYDTAQDPIITNVTSVGGNVITDTDGIHGQDNVPAGAIISEVAGQAITGETTIVGNYGTLVIKPDGSYTYTPNSDVTVIGKTEMFEYTVIDPVTGKSDNANLTIQIGTNSNDEAISKLAINADEYYETSAGDDISTASIGDENITSTASHDVITTGAGADTVIYNLLNVADATGGNGKDEWTDFNLAQGDKVDVSALLDGANADNIANYVSVISDGEGNTLISIDRDGTGNNYNSTDLIVLKNTDTTLDELLNNNQLLF